VFPQSILKGRRRNIEKTVQIRLLQNSKCVLDITKKSEKFLEKCPKRIAEGQEWTVGRYIHGHSDHFGLQKIKNGQKGRYAKALL